MKKYLLPFAMFLFSSQVLSQTPEEYLKQVPPIPEKMCSMNQDEVQKFENQMSDLTKKIQKDVKKREKELDSPEFKKKYMKKNLPELSEYSEEELENMENLSEEEQKKIAMRMVEKYMNKPNSERMKEFEEKKEMSDLSIDIVDVNAGGYATKMKEIENDYTIVQTSADEFYKSNITPLYTELNKIPDGEGGTGENDPDVIKYKELQKKIIIQKNELCKIYSNKYSQVLQKHLALYKEELPNLRQLETLKLKDFDIPNRDILSIKELLSYLKYYDKAMKYNPGVI